MLPRTSDLSLWDLTALEDLPLQGEVLRTRPSYVGSAMNDPKGAAMSHKSIVRAVLLLVLVAALGICVAEVTASWNTGSEVGASWDSGTQDAPE